MKKPYRLGILLLATTLFQSCSDLGSEVIPLPMLRVEPDSGIIGLIVTLHGAHFKASPPPYMVRFLGANNALIADSSSDSTIYTFVPFGARSGPVEVYSDGHDGITGEFRVTESPDPFALTVQTYDISPPVTAKDSVVVDSLGISRTWRVDFQGDTVHLSRSYSSGEELYEYHLVLLDQGPIQLPRVVALWVRIQPDHPLYWIDPIPAGILKLQQYDRRGVIAGKFFGVPSISRMLNGTFTIWAEHRQ